MQYVHTKAQRKNKVILSQQHQVEQQQYFGKLSTPTHGSIVCMMNVLHMYLYKYYVLHMYVCTDTSNQVWEKHGLDSSLCPNTPSP